MVVLKIRAADGQFFRFRVEECTLDVVREKLEAVGSQNAWLVLSDGSRRPLSDAALQAALDSGAEVLKMEVCDGSPCGSPSSASESIDCGPAASTASTDLQLEPDTAPSAPVMDVAMEQEPQGSPSPQDDQRHLQHVDAEHEQQIWQSHVMGHVYQHQHAIHQHVAQQQQTVQQAIHEQVAQHRRALHQQQQQAQEAVREHVAQHWQAIQRHQQAMREHVAQQHQAVREHVAQHHQAVREHVARQQQAVREHVQQHLQQTAAGLQNLPQQLRGIHQHWQNHLQQHLGNGPVPPPQAAGDLLQPYGLAGLVELFVAVICIFLFTVRNASPEGAASPAHWADAIGCAAEARNWNSLSRVP